MYTTLKRSTNIDPQPLNHDLNDSEKTQFKLNSHIASNNSSHTINQNNTNKNANRNKIDKSRTTTPNNDEIMVESPGNEYSNDDNTKLDRTLQLVTTSVIINKHITNPVTLELRPNHSISNINVTRVHHNIFIFIKMKDPTLIIISNEVIIDTEFQFTDDNDYINHKYH